MPSALAPILETAPASADLGVHQLMEAQADKTPDAIAVIFGQQTLTYRQLETRANQLANRLVSLGVGPEVRVAVAMRPSAEVIVALYGILKAGGAYVPVDVDAPSERLAFILANAEVRCVVTQPDLASSLPTGGWRSLSLPEGWDGGGEDSSRRSRAIQPDQLAYVIYTSGSTGEPKGVMVAHRSVVNHNLGMAEQFTLGPSDRVLQFTPVHFDAAGEEIFPALSRGSAIVVRGELVPTEQFAELIRSAKLTVLSLPPAYVHDWLTDLAHRGGQVPAGLKLVVLGGEKLLPETWALWLKCGGSQVPWMNVYGPTEATVTSASYLIHGAGLQAQVLPIGKPVPGARLYLLDEALAPVPQGEVGELFIAGLGLARGYVGRADLTATAFLPDPHGTHPGARMYRTGDLARSLPSGDLEFVGRADHQVKIRGNRVELGEIESQLRKDPTVKDALVVASGEGNDKRLLAYVVAQPEAHPSRHQLRAALSARLPDYMVPAIFVLLDAFPLTANGKVDRKALPPPTATDENTYVAPKGELQQMLCEVWAEVLSAPRVGIEDDFFELGGHSLAALRIVSRAEEMGLQLEVRDLFDSPTVAKLSARLEASGAVPMPSPEAADNMSDEEVDAMLRQLAKAQQHGG